MERNITIGGCHLIRTASKRRMARSAEGSDVKKMVRSSQRQEMARSAVDGERTSIRHACQVFDVSQTC